VSGRELLAALQRKGYELTHVRGSHHYLRKPNVAALVVVPVHGNHPLPLGTLRSILRQAGLTVDDLRNIL
jgi:predicted RNA binding protein YcfA (HicA-like mRNA interferase family)